MTPGPAQGGRDCAPAEGRALPGTPAIVRTPLEHVRRALRISAGISAQGNAVLERDLLNLEAALMDAIRALEK